ncbi:hypothetical protein [Hymenobacter sp. GOD-10R]|uniref:hypothetical protein n=1 Tax=Hymenobacter sp. GOD-10R TaxID=3093922 RepID=UPI002D779509|nr:hypothetical protein [Hymenobacter sp. GOD-10R]WRQ28572.1 hypothetical protein SD425_26240 [Hymenobacter sp. GOD-10R]
MRFDRALLRTILFSLTVVAMVIGVYQTVLQDDPNAVRDNYWLFTFAFSFYLIYWYLGRKDREAAALPPKKPTPAAPVSKAKPARKKR